jgi:hypothetical protein
LHEVIAAAGIDENREMFNLHFIGGQTPFDPKLKNSARTWLIRNPF